MGDQAEVRTFSGREKQSEHCSYSDEFSVQY